MNENSILKSLHTCNIANVAYGYCKILVEKDHPVDLRCHDIRHLMSQPEWDDIELDPMDFPDENNFYSNTAEFGNYKRPDWYQSDEMWGADSDASFIFRSKVFRNLIQTLRELLPTKLKHRLIPIYHFLTHWNNLSSMERQSLKKIMSRCGELSDESTMMGAKWAVEKNILKQYLPHVNWLSKHIDHHDVIFSYVFSPVYAMIYNQLPYIGIEIGTMRDIPFDGSNLGKVLWLAYRKANHIIITNPDNKELADRLGVRNYSFCPHPLDEDICAPHQKKKILKSELRKKYLADIVLFAPARQNWVIKGNDKYLRAFKRLIAAGINAVLLVPGWGQEVDRSKKLCADLQVGDRVIWLAPMSEKLLIKHYQASDMVLDQFQLGVFGLITPKAMACEKPVLTSYNPAFHRWCFPKDPPVVTCETEEEIYSSMYRLATNLNQRSEIGRQSRGWILNYHSKGVIREILLNAMKMAKENFDKIHFSAAIHKT